MTFALGILVGWLIAERARLIREVRRGDRFVASTIRQWRDAGTAEAADAYLRNVREVM